MRLSGRAANQEDACCRATAVTMSIGAWIAARAADARRVYHIRL